MDYHIPDRKVIVMTKKAVKIIIPVFIIATAFIAVLIGINSKNQVKADEPNYIDGPVLKEGKYYVDGDKEQYYLEVTKNTIQLKNVDYVEYASYGNSTDSLSDSSKAELEKVVKSEADRISKPLEYKSINIPASGANLIFTHWSESDGNISGGGYEYIDENTVKRGKEIFIYEDAVSSYKVNEIPTRIVDSISFKENSK